HETLEEDSIERGAGRAEGRGEVNAVAHQRAVGGRLEAVRVTPALEGAAPHLVCESARGVERDDLRGHALPDAEERAFPRHLLAQINQPGGDARHGAVSERTRREHVQVNAARRVEADGGGRANKSVQADYLHT